MRRLGFGYFTDGKDPDEWAADFVDWIDRYCFYRSRAEIEATYLRYFAELIPLEEAHAGFRVRERFGPGMERLVQLRPARPAVRFAMRKLAHLTFLAVKDQDG
jgi:hypothetical protein